MHPSYSAAMVDPSWTSLKCQGQMLGLAVHVIRLLNLHVQKYVHVYKYPCSDWFCSFVVQNGKFHRSIVVVVVRVSALPCCDVLSFSRCVPGS